MLQKWFGGFYIKAWDESVGYDIYAQIIRLNDKFLGLCCLFLFGVIAVNWHNPLWNGPLAFTLWSIFLLANYGFSFLTLRSKRVGRLEVVRGLFSLLMQIAMFFATGGARGDYWYGFGICVIGMSALYLAADIPSEWPLLIFPLTYLGLSFTQIKSLSNSDLGHVLGEFGIMCLMARFLVRVMKYLLQRTARLREEKDRFQQLSEHISEVFWIQNADRSKLLYISPAYQKIWGRSCESLYQNPMDFLNAIHPEDRPKIAEVIRNRERLEFDLEYRVVTPEGVVRWVRDRAFAVRDEFGKPIRVAGVAQDITENKNAAERLEIQRMAIVQSSKMSSLGEMAAGIAHEVNNPLATILALAEHLQNLGRKEAVLQGAVMLAAERIESTALRIDKIVKGLRWFAQEGEDEKVQLVSLASILEDTLVFCESRFRHHQIELRLPLIDPELMLECRPVQISQVLLNLLNNSLDAVDGLNCLKWVEIGIVNHENLVELSVTDSGRGIPSDLATKVMLPFFTTKPQGKGMGLGLSISRGIVESHQGALTIDVTNRNTRLVVTLPKKVTQT